MLTELPSNTWIGVYLDKASSVSDSNDKFLIRHNNSKWNRYTASSIEPGLFYHIYQTLKQQLTFQFIRNPKTLTAKHAGANKLKVEVKRE